MKKKVVIFFVVCILILGFISILTVLFDLWNGITSNIIFSCIAMLCFSIPFLCCYTIYKKPSKKIVSIIGMVICFICCGYILLVQWGLVPFHLFDGISWKIYVESILLPISLGHISLLLFFDLKTGITRWVRFFTIMISLLFDASIFLILFFGLFANVKYICILIILIAIGTILTLILNKLIPSSTIDRYEQLKKLKELLDQQVITEEEYQKEKVHLLNLDEREKKNENRSATN